MSTGDGEGRERSLVSALTRSLVERDNLLRQLSKVEARLLAHADKNAPTPSTTPGDHEPLDATAKQSNRARSRPEENESED